MLGAINPTMSSLQYPTLQPDEAATPRRKRSIEPDQSQWAASDINGPSANDRHRNGGGLDSLGGGRLL